MNKIRVFKKFLIPSAVAVNATTKDGEPVCDAEGKRLVRPSDLPIYGDECYICGDKPCDDPCALEAQIGHLRKELWVWVDTYKGYRSQVKEVCARGQVHAESLLVLLREESNYLPRAGAIGLSGLAGIVFGLRGGIIRKLVYGTTGAGAMAAVCYPREAAEYTHESLHLAKKYVKIGYNFIYGVKPDYIKLPDPSSFLVGADVSKSSSVGADVSKSSSVGDPVVDEKGPRPEMPVPTAKETPSPASGDNTKTSLVRDQSKSEDKSMYTTRSK